MAKARKPRLLGRSPIPEVHLVVDEDNKPVGDIFFMNKKAAERFIKEELIEENCGPCRPVRFAPLEEPTS
jgi:hypothetical protein